ncbi:MAG TPA: hypothetical protein VGM91_12170 [Conexibacter sp.]|jgi:hypothetical protein
MTRRILNLDGSEVTVSRQARFDSEQLLDDVVTGHPEVLPSEDLGLGPLVALGRQVDFGAGPIDLLAVDPQGRLAIVEFKRGTENPDVRRVIAQLLDYGSSLWRTPYNELECRCAASRGCSDVRLVDLVAERCTVLDTAFDPEAFRRGIESTLDAGDFVFLYVGRDLDERTRRIMTYLAEGPRMTFFAVEVDYYTRAVGETAVLVPRTAFVPTWIAEAPAGASSRMPRSGEPASREFRELTAHMDEVASELGLIVKSSKTGRNYQLADPERGVKYTSGIGVYSSGRGAEFNLSVFRELGHDRAADDLLQRIRDVTGESTSAAHWPSVPCESLIRDWPRTREQLIKPYFTARSRLHSP